MKISNVVSAVYEPDDAIVFQLEVDAGEGLEVVPFAYREIDPYSGEIGTYLTAWISENKGSIVPYVPPAPPTIEQIRAKMPALTSRQFWMAAANIDIDKDVLLTAIKADMPDTVDRKMMIAELESSSFERLNPTVIDLMALMSIPPEQVDDLWVWAAKL